MLNLHRVLCVAGLLLAVLSALASADSARDIQDWTSKRLWSGFADGAFSSAIVVVVNPRRELALQAVGYADVAAGKLADVGASRFRLSSITKLFTAVAVAQLLERGMIESLDDSVNRYLKRWQLPANRGQDITIHHLLTHSAGFDRSRYGIWRNPNDGAGTVRAASLDRYLPAYVRPAGDWAVYSNFGGALLGLMVEDVVGETMAHYLTRHVFEPLDMHHSGFGSDRGRGAGVRSYYLYSNGTVAAQKRREYSDLMALSMGVESSARDMGRFLRMLLNGGVLGGARVLQPESVDLLLRERFSNHPAANGLGMLFDVVHQNGSLMLYMHNGSTPGFGSHLVICPDRGLGFFAAVAGYQATAMSGPGRVSQVEQVTAPLLAAEFVRQFIEPYEFRPQSQPRNRAVKLTGHYLTEKRPLASPEAIFDLFHPPRMVRVGNSDGRYRSNGREAREVAGDVYMHAGPWAYREMYRFENGEPVLSLYGSEILRRVHPWLTPGAKRQWMLGLSGVLLLGTWTLCLRVRSRGQHQLRLLQLLFWPLLACFPLYIFLQEYGTDSLLLRVQLADHTPLVYASALANGLLIATLLLCAFCYRAWRGCWWGQRVFGSVIRAQLTLQAAAALALVGLLWSLNLVGLW